jgi:hypothetical protein
MRLFAAAGGLTACRGAYGGSWQEGFLLAGRAER